MPPGRSSARCADEFFFWATTAHARWSRAAHAPRPLHRDDGLAIATRSRADADEQAIDKQRQHPSGNRWRAERRQAIAAYLFLSPAMLIFFVFTLLPVAYAFALS